MKVGDILKFIGPGGDYEIFSDESSFIKNKSYILLQIIDLINDKKFIFAKVIELDTFNEYLEEYKRGYITKDDLVDKVLINSKPEDRIVLCADMFCWCNWINDISCYPGQSVLKSLLGDDPKNIGRQFFKLMKLDRSVHKRVAYSNQQIYHKSLYFEWKKYLEDNDCLNKVKWFVDKITPNMDDTGSSDVKRYSNIRLHAYFMEMLNIAWFTNNDFKFI